MSSAARLGFEELRPELEELVELRPELVGLVELRPELEELVELRPGLVELLQGDELARKVAAEIGNRRRRVWTLLERAGVVAVAAAAVGGFVLQLIR